MLTKPKKRALILAAAGVVAAGIAVPAIAYADPTPAPSTSAPSTAEKPGPGAHDEKFAAALAQELGLDQQKVADALAKVREQVRPEHPGGKRGGEQPPSKEDRAAKLKERLDQAVKDGKLTQAEADAIAKAEAAGVLGGGRPGR